MDGQQVLSGALDVGKQMLVSGGEVYRVEECIRRICQAYGARRVDVFTITSSIVVTMVTAEGEVLTQTRRISATQNDLDRVDRLNQLSREMCESRMDHEEFSRRFAEIEAAPQYPQWLKLLTYGCVTAAFTVFFGGSWADAGLSFFIGLVLNRVVYLCGAAGFNGVISNLMSSFAVSALAMLGVKLGLAQSVEMIVIGNIMPLIPGSGLTNSLRDMISGDTMAGILRFSEACIMALAIAAGYILAAMVLGGLLG